MPATPDAAYVQQTTTQAGEQAYRFWEQMKIPTQQQLVDSFMQAGVLQAILMIVVGIVFLLYGWKLFKALVIVDAAALGVALGYYAGEWLGKQNTSLGGANMDVIGAIAGGLLLAALALPLMKFAVSIIGGLLGAVLGYGLWRYIATAANKPDLVQYSWAGALIGLVTLGLLAFIIFRFTLMLLTSFQGAALIVPGSLALLLKYYGPASELHQNLVGNVHLLPLLIAVPTVIGFALQCAWTGKKGPRKPQASHHGG